jgi:hypothetical protein
VPGTRYGARPDASKQGARIGARHPVRRQGGMLANRDPNRCQAPGAAPGRIAIDARHPVRQVPDERFLSGRPMIDIATEILQSLQARNGKRIGIEEDSVFHPLPWDIRTNAAGYSVIVDATGTEVLLAFGDDFQTSRAVAEFVVRLLLSYSRP